MGTRGTASTIDEYIAAFPPDTRKGLEDMRAVINAAAPDATESISYAIPEGAQTHATGGGSFRQDAALILAHPEIQAVELAIVDYCPRGSVHRSPKGAPAICARSCRRLGHPTKARLRPTYSTKENP